MGSPWMWRIFRSLAPALAAGGAVIGYYNLDPPLVGALAMIVLGTMIALGIAAFAILIDG